MQKKIIVSKTIIISSFFIFIVMLILNSLTPLCTDDYVYSYSFAEGKIDEYIKIDNILDIFPSMYNHAFTQNGRLVAHFFTQFFLMYSKILFNYKWQKILFCVSGIFMGDYLENISFGTILAIFGFLILLRVWKHMKPERWVVAHLACLIGGYVFLLVCPGTGQNKIVKPGIRTYAENFMNALYMYKYYLLWLFILWLVLFCCSLYLKHRKEDLACSLLFVSISIIMNFMNIISSYYPGRSMFGSTIFLILGCTCLFSNYFGVTKKMYAVSVSAVLILFASLKLIEGGYDILNTYIDVRNREIYIAEQKEKGNLDLVVDLIQPKTEYSARYGLVDLKTEKSNTWPNTWVADYYGLDSIKGNVVD